jgi:gliding motility-associated-like protein
VVNNILVLTSTNNSVTFGVTFSENVTGADVSDFTLTVSALTGTSISSISGSGASYFVVVNIGTGNGSIRLDLKNAGTGISDKAANAITTGYTTGQLFYTKPVLKITDPAPVCGSGVVDLSAAEITAGSDPGLSFSYFTDAAATQVVGNPASVAVSGTYYIRGNIASSLTDLLAVNVTINPLPLENIQISNGTVLCGNLASTTLSVSAGNSYLWAKDGVVLNAATSNQVLVSGAGGVYSVTITTAAGCTAAAGNKVTVTLIQPPVAAFGYDSYCSSVPVHFINNSVIANSGTVNYVWSDNTGNSSSLAAPVFTYNQVGNYQVKLKVSSQQCPSFIDSISKPIAVEIPTPAIRLPFVNLNIVDPVVLQARTFGASYTWSPVTGLSSASVVTPVARMEEETQFTITIVAPSGCKTVDTLLVKVFADRVYVPAAFTPNGDGLNDKLFVNLIGMKQLQHFVVYNRYGKKMFETSNLSEGWDGTFSGVKQPLDTYIWTVEGTDKFGYYISKRGAVTLIR